MTSSLTPDLLTACVGLVTRFLTAAMVRSGLKPMGIGAKLHTDSGLTEAASETH